MQWFAVLFGAVATVGVCLLSWAWMRLRRRQLDQLAALTGLQDQLDRLVAVHIHDLKLRDLLRAADVEVEGAAARGVLVPATARCLRRHLRRLDRDLHCDRL